jgi:hypothetical protein
MVHNLINNIEKTAKAVIYSSIALILLFIVFIVFSELSGKSISTDCNFPYFGLLINIAILILILVSIYEFIQNYRNATHKHR